MRGSGPREMLGGGGGGWAAGSIGAAYRTGYWYGPNGVASTSAPANNSLRVAPLVIGPSTPFDRIALEVTAAGEAGCTLRLLVYADAGYGQPGALLLDAGTIAGDAIATPQLTIAQSLSGLVWVGPLLQGAPTTQPTVRTLTTTFVPTPVGLLDPAQPFAGYVQTGLAGAPPATFAVNPGLATPPLVRLRAA